MQRRRATAAACPEFYVGWCLRFLLRPCSALSTDVASSSLLLHHIQYTYLLLASWMASPCRRCLAELCALPQHRYLSFGRSGIGPFSQNHYYYGNHSFVSLLWLLCGAILGIGPKKSDLSSPYSPLACFWFVHCCPLSTCSSPRTTTEWSYHFRYGIVPYLWIWLLHILASHKTPPCPGA